MFRHTTALTIDGGYAEYMEAYEDGIISIPDEISPEEAAPLWSAMDFLDGGKDSFPCRHKNVNQCL